MAGIQLTTNFDVNTGLPLDSREVVADLTARDAISDLVRYEGLEVYVTAEAKSFKLVGGITNDDWQSLDVRVDILENQSQNYDERLDAIEGSKDEITLNVIEEGPESVSGGTVAVYAKEDGIYYKNSDDEETKVGTGSGGGTGINYLSGVTPVAFDDGYEVESYPLLVDALEDSINTGGVNRFYVGQKIRYSTDGTIIGGLTNNTDYYVVSVGAAPGYMFKLSATLGGSAINLTSSGSGMQYFRPYSPTDGSGGEIGSSMLIATFEDELSQPYYIVDAGGYVGKGLSWDFPVSEPDRGRVLTLSFEYTASQNVGASFWIIHPWTGKRIQPTNYEVKRRDIFSTAILEFQAPIDADALRLCLIQTTTNDSWGIHLHRFTLGPQTKSVGDLIIDEYAVNTSGITAAGASNSNSANMINGGEGSLAAEGVAIGNINTGTPSTFTEFIVEFSDDSREGDEVFLEVKGSNHSAWMQSTVSIAPFTVHGSSNYGAGISRVSNEGRRHTVNFGNMGRALGGTYAASGADWANVATWKWRVRRRRVIKNVALSSAVSGRPVLFKVKNVAGTHTLNANWQKVTAWGSPVSDSIGAWDASKSAFILKTSEPVRAHGQIAFATNAAGFRGVRVCLNGALYEYVNITPAATGAGTIVPFSTTIYGSAGDEITIEAVQSSGGNLDYGASDTSTLNIESVSSGSQVIAASEDISCRYTTGSGQSIPSGATTTVNFGTKVWDSHNAVTTGSSWRFTAPVAGEYEIVATTQASNGGAAFGENTISVYKNGASLISQTGWPSIHTAATNISTFILTKVKLLKGETVHVTLDINKSGGYSLVALGNRNYIEIRKVGNY